jgi:poly(A) polymerase
LIPPPLVTGRDLIQLGLAPGPAFKGLLEAVQTEQLEGRLYEREPALAYLGQLLAKIHPTDPTHI